ncbi:MAG: hypothetical protein Q8L41_01205 [Anaerolineales bacterium]|nr:hypothetical protein [Anaerolineales bacterium]
MTTQDEKQDTVQTSAYNPFPEPQTIPSGWDTSGFLSAPEPAPISEAEDSAENEQRKHGTRLFTDN